MRNCLSDTDLDRLIAEDLPHGDLTTHTLEQVVGWTVEQGSITFLARDAMCVCGSEEAQRLFGKLGADATVVMPSGRAAESGTILLQATGPVESLFAAWKLAQTLIEWASGLASAVAQLVTVASAANPATIVACTRKTVPFTRGLAAKAVRAGGGSMHRLNLSDSLLLFPEHLQFVNTDSAPANVLAQLRRAAPERSLVAEVITVEQALVFAGHVDVLQLEKFSVADVQRVVHSLAGATPTKPVLAAAGGINPGNAAAYAAAGAKVLVTSWPYQAAPRDVQVRFGVGNA